MTGHAYLTVQQMGKKYETEKYAHRKRKGSCFFSNLCDSQGHLVMCHCKGEA